MWVVEREVCLARRQLVPADRQEVDDVRVVRVVGCVPAGAPPHFPFMSPCCGLRPELSDGVRPEDVLKRPEEVLHQVGGQGLVGAGRAACRRRSTARAASMARLAAVTIAGGGEASANAALSSSVVAASSMAFMRASSI